MIERLKREEKNEVSETNKQTTRIQKKEQQKNGNRSAAVAYTNRNVQKHLAHTNFYI